MPGHVSPRACSGFDYFVSSAAKHTMAASPGDCEVTPLETLSGREREIVMLTVSSYMFRAVLFIHFDRDPSTRAHFAALDGLEPETMNEDRFIDAVMERGNLCCGSLNRELAAFFPHTGMSTPCILERHAIDHVHALGPAVTRYYQAQFSSGLVLHLTLAVCAFADMDFPFEPRAEVEDETAGELELF